MPDVADLVNNEGIGRNNDHPAKDAELDQILSAISNGNPSPQTEPTSAYLTGELVHAWQGVYRKHLQYLLTRHPIVRDELVHELVVVWMEVAEKIARRRIPAHLLDENKHLARAYAGDVVWSILFKEYSLSTAKVSESNQSTGQTQSYDDDTSKPEIKLFSDPLNPMLLKIDSPARFFANAIKATRNRLEDYARKERWSDKPRTKKEPDKSKPSQPQVQNDATALLSQGKQQASRMHDDIVTLDADAKMPRDIHNTDVVRDMAGCVTPGLEDFVAEIDRILQQERLISTIEAALPPDQQKAIRWYLSYPEATRAEVAYGLGVAEEAYKNKLALAKKNLKNRMVKLYPNW